MKTIRSDPRRRPLSTSRPEGRGQQARIILAVLVVWVALGRRDLRVHHPGLHLDDRSEVDGERPERVTSAYSWKRK